MTLAATAAATAALRPREKGNENIGWPWEAFGALLRAAPHQLVPATSTTVRTCPHSFIAIFFPSGPTGLRRVKRWHLLHSPRTGNGLEVMTWLGSAWPVLTWPVLAWRGVAWRGVDPFGVARFGLVWFGLAWLGLAWLGLAWLGLAWLGLAWLGSARLGSARLGSVSARLGSARLGSWSVARARVGSARLGSARLVLGSASWLEARGVCVLACGWWLVACATFQERVVCGLWTNGVWFGCGTRSNHLPRTAK